MIASMKPPPPSTLRPDAKPVATAPPFVPVAPKNLREAGLNPATVEALILKHLLNVGSDTGGSIAKTVCIANAPIIELLGQLKQQQIIVYVGSAGAGDFTYTLTDAGRDRARRMMDESMYVGAAPVPFNQYVASVKAQTITVKNPSKEDLRAAFSDLLISEEMFRTLGPAINSGRGMFLYGYPGNGKTSIAERVTRCFGDEIYIPRVVIVDGLLIKVFDAESHEAIEVEQESIMRSTLFDPRWIKIKRPTILVGGELTMDALEVRFNPITKVCEASTQMKSNCGTLVIDDFGRQRMKPIELLNRWIVPLEKRFDYLALPNGKKIQVPFDQLIIFSTNLEPKDLVDDAFLRRIPYKINVPDPTEEEFRRLFEIFAPKMELKFRKEAIDELVQKHYAGKRPFRCCHPRDLMLQIRNLCLYQGIKPEMTTDNFDYAASVYFTVM